MIRNFTKKQTGFTLIELLVVIAIIGLLSSIVVVAFGAIRTSARDTAVRANMSQMRLAAELQFDAVGNYANTLSRADYIAAAGAATAAGATGINFIAIANSYCFRAVLPGGTSWCIDSTGRVGNSPAAGCSAAPHACN